MSGLTDQIHSKQQLQDVNYMPPLKEAVPLGIQHVLAMFISNVTVPLIIAGAAGLDQQQTIFLVQAAMLMAGVATLIQTLGVGPIGARLPIVMGTSFGFLPVMIPVAQGYGLGAVLGAAFAGGLAMALVGLGLRWVRFLFPPVVTGLFVIMIGILLLPVGFAYAGGGFGAADFGAPQHLLLALVVFVTTICFHQFGKGLLSELSVLFGILLGYLIAIPMGLVDFSKIGAADWFQGPIPLHFGLEFHFLAVFGVVLMAIVTCAESIGDIAGTAIGGANREPTDKELSGGVIADGLSSSLAAVFNAFPQISFSQNVGLVALTGVASRYVVAIGGAFLVVAGLLPKLGAAVLTVPNGVLGGALIIIFGLITSAGMKMLSQIEFDKRNMLIIGVSLAVAIGLRSQEGLYAGASEGVKAILHSGLIPGAVISILLNLVLPGRDRAPARPLPSEAAESSTA